MNFLAHFHLAWPDEGLVAGGLEGDFYKGPLRDDLPAALREGVKLHRAIDAYTDQHPDMLVLRRHLPDTLRRYAGIIADLSFDHYLSIHWHRFSDQSLPEFNRSIYAILQRHHDDFSPSAQQMMSRILEHDILGIYDRWQTVTATAERIGRRFGQRNPFHDIERELTPHRELLEQTFLNFYPQLQSFSRARVSASPGSDTDRVARPGKSP